MSGHPIADEDILAYAAGELDDAAAAVVAAHIDRCLACAATVARYRLVSGTLRADDSLSPPAATVARAKAIFAEQRRPVFDPLAPLRRIVARLTFDSRGGFGPALAGFRGDSGPYQVAFADDMAEVDLQVEPPLEPGGRWQLLGQVVGDEVGAGIDVALARPGTEETVVAAEADRDGVFSLAAPAGHYDVLVRLPDALLVLPDLEVG